MGGLLERVATTVFWRNNQSVDFVTLNAMNCVIFVIVGLLSSFHFITACYIQGTDLGECSNVTIVGEDAAGWRLLNMPYCVDAVIYPACLPKRFVSIIFTQATCLLS